MDLFDYLPSGNTKFKTKFILYHENDSFLRDFLFSFEKSHGSTSLDWNKSYGIMPCKFGYRVEVIVNNILANLFHKEAIQVEIEIA